MIPAVIIGKKLHWLWTRNVGLRLTHAVLTGYVVLETLLRIPCPLTMLENSLRQSDGDHGYTQNGCVMDWFIKITGHQLPTRIFEVVYVSLFIYVMWLYYTVAPKPKLKSERK